MARRLLSCDDIFEGLCSCTPAAPTEHRSPPTGDAFEGPSSCPPKTHMCHRFPSSGDVFEGRDDPPAHYSFKIQSFSSLSKAPIEKYTSDKFEAGGYKWNLSIYPTGNKKSGGKGHISIGLALVNTSSLPLGWEVKAIFNLFVFDQLRDKYFCLPDGKVRRFHAMKTKWEEAKFIELGVFRDAANGYLINDKCVFGAEIFVIKQIQKQECLSMMEKPVAGLYTWAVKPYSTSSIAERCHSDLFNVGDYKWKDLSGRTLKLISGSCYLPCPDKEETGGEDAHFICANEQAIGVADGVGGWADLGVDSGLFSRELMSNSVAAIQEEPKGSVDLVRVLEKAHSSTKAEGSSTACIIALTDQGLQAINLGDSGFMVVRGGRTVFRSPVQQHEFNFPYQLESGNSRDLPSSGQVFTIPVAPGDVVIAGTDGLFDNLYSSEVAAVVVHARRAGLGPQVTAQKIAALARQRAQDKNRQTPFSTAAQDAGHCYYGGKLDDITVVVSYITSISKG